MLTWRYYLQRLLIRNQNSHLIWLSFDMRYCLTNILIKNLNRPPSLITLLTWDLTVNLPSQGIKSATPSDHFADMGFYFSNIFIRNQTGYPLWPLRLHRKLHGNCSRIFLTRNQIRHRLWPCCSMGYYLHSSSWEIECATPSNHNDIHKDSIPPDPVPVTTLLTCVITFNLFHDEANPPPLLPTLLTWDLPSIYLHVDMRYYGQRILLGNLNLSSLKRGWIRHPLWPQCWHGILQSNYLHQESNPPPCLTITFNVM